MAASRACGPKLRACGNRPVPPVPSKRSRCVPATFAGRTRPIPCYRNTGLRVGLRVERHWFRTQPTFRLTSLTFPMLPAPLSPWPRRPMTRAVRLGMSPSRPRAPCGSRGAWLPRLRAYRCACRRFLTGLRRLSGSSRPRCASCVRCVFRPIVRTASVLQNVGSDSGPASRALRWDRLLPSTFTAARDPRASLGRALLRTG